MSVLAEVGYIREVFGQVEEIEQVAASLPASDQRSRQLAGVVDRILSHAPPVRAAVASGLLDLTEKTVRAWAREGVLTVRQQEPRVLLDPVRLHKVMHLIADFRRAGRTHGLLDEVYRRLSDDALMDRHDLAVSLEQMRLGRGKVVRQ